MKNLIFAAFASVIIGAPNFAGAQAFEEMIFNCQMSCGKIGSNGCYGFDVAGELKKSPGGQWAGTLNKFIFAPDRFELNTHGMYDYAGILAIDVLATLKDAGGGLLVFNFDPGGIHFPQILHMEDGGSYIFEKDTGWRTNRFSLNMKFDPGTMVLRQVTADVERSVTGRKTQGLDVSCKFKFK